MDILSQSGVSFRGLAGSIDSEMLISHVTALIPPLIFLLNPNIPDDSIFISASDALQELAARSVLSDGSGSKTLTEPLMVWLDSTGNQIVENMLAADDVSPIAHSL